MIYGNVLLLEDGKVIGNFSSVDEAITAMKAEHRKDLFSIIAKRRLLNLFVRGKYKLKEYCIVEVAHVKTINSDDDLGGIF